MLSLLQQDEEAAEKEARLAKELDHLRAFRAALALVILGIDPNARGFAGRAQKAVGTRPRRGWTTIIRHYLRQTPGSTFDTIATLAINDGKRPEGTTNEEFRERLRFALRDMKKKGFVRSFQLTSGLRTITQYYLTETNSAPQDAEPN